jgi:hypothetical protein
MNGLGQAEKVLEQDLDGQWDAIWVRSNRGKREILERTPLTFDRGALSLGHTPHDKGR